MANTGLSPGLVAELEELRKEKDRLEKEVSDFQGMVKRIQSTRVKISDTNVSDSVTGLRRNTAAAQEKVAKLREHQRALLAQKFAIEEQLKAEADKQVARREELEELMRKVGSELTGSISYLCRSRLSLRRRMRSAANLKTLRPALKPS